MSITDALGKSILGAGYSNSACLKPTLQQNFDITQYVGNWYEFARVPNSFEDGICDTATYTLQADGTVQVLNQEYLPDVPEVASALGVARCSSTVSGQCQVRFSSYSPWGPYDVVSTDYVNYSIVYSCTNIIGAFSYELLWILSRQPYQTGSAEAAEFQAQMYSIINETLPGYNTDQLTITPQGSSCVYNL